MGFVHDPHSTAKQLNTTLYRETAKHDTKDTRKTKRTPQTQETRKEHHRHKKHERNTTDNVASVI